VPSQDYPLIRSAVPVWGGPTGTGTVDLGTQLCLYGNGVVLGETFAGKARTGIADGSDDQEGYWEAPALPSSGGDSGSGVVTCNGVTGEQAAGILTHGLITEVGTITWGTLAPRAVAMVAKDWKH